MIYILVDLEATCWQRDRDRSRMETIEIGAVRLESSAGPAVDEFASFVRPLLEPVLSLFCRQLTSIRQEDVDAADHFPVVLQRFVSWIGGEPFRLCSWGDYDLKQLRLDCARHGLTLPPTFESHINLRRVFAEIRVVKSCTMQRALAIEKLPLVGTHHRGIDDARNLAGIAARILPRLEGRARKANL